LSARRRTRGNADFDGRSTGAETPGPRLGENGSVAYFRPDRRGREAFERTRKPLARRNERLVRLVLSVADVLALLTAFVFASAVIHAPRSQTALAIVLASVPLWLVAIQSTGLYDRENDVIAHSPIDELPDLARLALVWAWGLLIVNWLAGTPALVSRGVAFWLVLTLLLPLLRLLARPVFRSMPTYPQNTLIVGAGTVGQLISRKLETHTEYHVNLLGFVDAQPMARRKDLESLTILGGPDELEALVEEHCVERVIIAFSNDSHEETMDLIRLLKDLDVRIDIVPRLFDIIPPRLSSHTIEGIPLITLPRLRLSQWSRFLKRSFDLVVGGAVVVLLGPTFLVTALLIKLDSRGPVLFRQLRMGAGGKPFYIFKFRTMITDADTLKGEIAHLNSHAAPGGDPRMFKVKHDPRVTRVGGLLRRCSLDEFPQLLNVLKGEMSLIGPRPLILEEDRYVEAWARKRLLLKPGMTGLWQVSGRNTIPFEDMVKLDYLYVTTWSLANDCRLLLQTLPLVVGGERAGHW